MSFLKRGILIIPSIRRLRESRDTLLDQRNSLSINLRACEEKQAIDFIDYNSKLSIMAATIGSPFFCYNASFDAQETIRRHAVPNLQPQPEYLTNFLGVIINPKFFPVILKGKAGLVEEAPIPANWHADIAEWAAALRAVELASDSFTMIELGCGWGCWMNNTGAAARRMGYAVHLIGVEGDESHIGFAHEAASANGFLPSQVTLHHGIAAAETGTALFPRQDQAGMSWDLKPIFGATEAQRDEGINAGRYDALPMIPLVEIAAPHARIDLLHIDIQGGEADLVAACLPLLAEKVAYLLVGTHSRSIEGRLFDMMLGAGWCLEIERPCILRLEGGAPVNHVDGVQGWRNPVLLPQS